MPLSFEEIGRRIKVLREARGLSIGDLAEATGMGESSVYKWERGERRPNSVQISAIAERLRVSTSEILGDEEPSSPERFAVTNEMALKQISSALKDAEEAVWLRSRNAELEAENADLRAQLVAPRLDDSSKGSPEDASLLAAELAKYDLRREQFEARGYPDDILWGLLKHGSPAAIAILRGLTADEQQRPRRTPETVDAARSGSKRKG